MLSPQSSQVLGATLLEQRMAEQVGAQQGLGQ